MGRRRGFTIVELMVVIAVIVILIAILLPALAGAREQARRVQCMSNIHQVTAAYLQYAADHDGELVPCDADDQQAGAPLPGQAQVIPALYRYAPADRIFHCPDDQHEGYRSYSINDFLGGSRQDIPHALRLRDVTNSARTFLLIEETPPIEKQGKTGGFVVEPYPLDVWIDIPATAHRHGTCLSYADGHGEYRAWGDPRTWALAFPPPFPHTPKNPDLQYLQSVEGFGNAPLR